MIDNTPLHCIEQQAAFAKFAKLTAVRMNIVDVTLCSSSLTSNQLDCSAFARTLCSVKQHTAVQWVICVTCKFLFDCRLSKVAVVEVHGLVRVKNVHTHYAASSVMVC